MVIIGFIQNVAAEVTIIPMTSGMPSLANSTVAELPALHTDNSQPTVGGPASGWPDGLTAETEDGPRIRDLSL